MGGKANNVEFTAIFDSGTSFTYLNEPAYSIISKQVSLSAVSTLGKWHMVSWDLLYLYMAIVQMNAGMKLKRFTTDPDFPFEYCYELP